MDGARFYINDRNAFEWSFEGETMRGVVHVDDVLFAVSGAKIRAAFVSKLAAAFKVMGAVEEATEFCGLQLDRDWVTNSSLAPARICRGAGQEVRVQERATAAMPFLLKKPPRRS